MSGERLQANLRALYARDPVMAAAIAAAPSLSVEPEGGATGHPTLVVDGVLLHNRSDPVREASHWAARQRERLESADATTAVVLGFGLGYHVEALASAWAGRIVVVEPDRALLRAALAIRDLRSVLPRIELAPEPLPTGTIDGWDRVELLPHGPSLLREGTRLRAVKERIAARAALRALRLRILVVSPLVGGSHPLTGYCARALAGLGHQVSVLDLAPYASGLEALPRFTPKKAARARVSEAWGRFLGSGIIAAVEAAQPDLVLAMAQAPLDAGVLAEIGKRGALRALWFVEDHRLFEYWQHVVPEYDYFFSIQDGGFVADAARRTAGHVAYLPCAADPAVHAPLALSPAERDQLGAPVGFVGAGYRNRRIVFRSVLDLGLKIWGTEWGGAGQVEAAVQRAGARISTEDCVRIFNATDVNLNLHSSTYVDGVDPRGDFVNPRTFEVAAAGAFQLVDRRTLLPSLLEPGREVATFADAAELRDLVRHYLAHPEERAAIAAAGRARVLAEHTYRHRMERILETVCARDYERLRARARETTVAEVAREEGETALGGLLRKLPPATPCTLDGVVQSLLHREGDLSDPEAILLFLHQFDEMYVREHRA